MYNPAVSKKHKTDTGTVGGPKTLFNDNV